MAALEVHVSLIQRKVSNAWGIPVAYELFVAVWAPDGGMLGVSGAPLAFQGEDNLTVQGRKAGFRYVVSMSWAWRSRREMAFGTADVDGGNEDEDTGLRSLGTGYLDDEVILGIGVDDVAQLVVRVKVQEMLGCLVLCADQDDNEDGGDGDAF
jgi:hypothetical protein